MVVSSGPPTPAGDCGGMGRPETPRARGPAVERECAELWGSGGGSPACRPTGVR
jgi:hypothetical protein